MHISETEGVDNLKLIELTAQNFTQLATVSFLCSRTLSIFVCKNCSFGDFLLQAKIPFPCNVSKLVQVDIYRTRLLCEIYVC